jgi:hypothetical protein
MGAVRQFSLRNDDRSSAKKGGTKSLNCDPLLAQLMLKSVSVCLALIGHLQPS